MSADRWQQLKDILHTAAHLPAAARSGYLRDACEGDADLLAEAESLLGADQAGDRVAHVVDAAAAAWADAASLVGRRLGAYEIVRELGRGGMGAVFLATRVDDEYRKQVAIKVVRAGIDTAETRRRFRMERQILADLDHPNIARLLDGGATDEGLPYVVMEYVDGEPLTAYCDRHRLTIDQRLRVFEQICAAVQFAHRNLVVHRDIKPGNILVTADGSPKLLDFGIAKVLDAPGAAPATRTGAQPMTPEYASPEQVRGEAITTATDVYALGVLLCELLSGHRPYRVAGRSARAVEDAITTEPPERPSTALFRATTAVSADAATVTAEVVADARATTADRLRRRLSGDLDVITLMALRKEPERRYPTVEQLAQDVRRHLEGLPVAARADTVRYRTGKFVGRHRVGVAASAAAVVLVGALTAFYAARLADERDRARAEGARAAQVAAFLQGLFEGADPSEAQGRDVTARELLALGAGRVERELAGDPAVQATMMHVIGRVQKSLGDFDAAATFLTAAETRLGQLAPDSLEQAAVLHDLGALANVQGDHARAAALLTRAYDVRRAHVVPPHADLVRTLSLQGFNEIDRGDLPRAEALLDAATAMGRALPETTADADALGLALDHLGRLRTTQSRYRDAEAVLEEALARRRRVFGDDHPSIGATRDLLAEVLRRDGRLAESETMFRAAVDDGRRILGDDHPAVTTRLGNLAIVLDNQGRGREAIVLHREVLGRHRATHGPTHPHVAATLNNLAASHSGLGEHGEAERLYLEALAIHRANHGAAHPSIATVLNNLAHVVAEKPDYEAAVRYQRQALAMDRALLGDEHVYVGMGQTLVGVFLLADGQVAAAAAPLRAGVAVISKALGPNHPTTAIAQYGLGKYLAAARQFDEGERVAREVIRIREVALPKGHWETALAATLLGEVLAGQGRDAEAERLLVDGFEIVKLQPARSRNRREARDRLVRFFRARGQPDRVVQIPP